MDDSHAKSQETRKRNEQIRKERHEREQAEHAAQLAALRLVRDHPDSTPAERLRAVELLLEIGKNGYRHI